MTRPTGLARDKPTRAMMIRFFEMPAPSRWRGDGAAPAGHKNGLPRALRAFV